MTPTTPEMASTNLGGTGRWRSRVGAWLSAFVALFFFVDAAAKLLRIEPVVKGTIELGWPASAVVPLGLLLLVGVVLYVVPRTSVVGAIYLTAFLGGAVATHYRIGSPVLTHVLFGVYVAGAMWSGLVLRYPAVLGVLLAPTGGRSPRTGRSG